MKPGDSFSQFITVEHIPFEKKHEDSYIYNFSRNELHMMAVYDGCGGLGARRYSALDNKTGAFLAAQTCAMVAEQWMNHATQQMIQTPGKLAELFMSQVTEELSALEKKYADNNKLLGTMVRTMPCTASMALVSPGEEPNAVTLTTFHTGDSRVYLLTPACGLQQMTRDDLRGNPDALLNLYVSAPLTNVVNIDVPFTMQTRSLQIEHPFAVLTATDGIFGYVRTPMDFENMLLNTLCRSATMSEFETTFRRDIAEISGDDATAVMAFYGWKSFEGIKKDFRRRSGEVAAVCAELDQDPSDDTIERLWEKYKPQAYI